MNRINIIINEFKHDNFDNFDEFYDSTKKLVYYIIYNIIRTKEDTEDLMQDTYIKFMENIHKINIFQSPLSYLSMIAKNLSINYYNKKKSYVIDSEFVYSIPEEKEELVDLGIVDLLEGATKEIVIMHIIGGMKFVEISSCLNKPLGTVLWLYNKGIKQLKKEVGE